MSEVLNMTWKIEDSLVRQYCSSIISLQAVVSDEILKVWTLWDKGWLLVDGLESSIGKDQFSAMSLSLVFLSKFPMFWLDSYCMKHDTGLFWRTPQTSLPERLRTRPSQRWFNVGTAVQGTALQEKSAGGCVQFLWTLSTSSTIHLKTLTKIHNDGKRVRICGTWAR